MAAVSYAFARPPPKRSTAKRAASILPKVTLSPTGLGTPFAAAYIGMMKLIDRWSLAVSSNTGAIIVNFAAPSLPPVMKL